MPEADITATPMNGMVLLTGTVAQPTDAAEAERLVQAFVGEGTQVVSRLRTATPQQVYLQVRIAEVSRTLARDIGINLPQPRQHRRLPVRPRPRQPPAPITHVTPARARSGHRRHRRRRPARRSSQHPGGGDHARLAPAACSAWICSAR